MNKSRKRRPNKQNDKGRVREKSFEREDDVGRDYNCYKSKPNDWRWYAQNEQMLRDTASFPYTWPLGHRLNLGSYATEVNKGSIPGIMVIDTSPSFGWSDNENSPINIAARNVYSYVRHANSGHANYDSPDLMLYLVAMDSAYAYLAWLKRVYGVVMTYSYTNRYYAKAMIQSMGVDYDNIQMNLADFRAYINTYAVKIGSLVVPASMSYTAKHIWMYSGYYLDSDQDKAQTYFFNPRGFFTFALDSDGAGSLVYTALTKYTPNASAVTVQDSELLTLQELKTYGDGIINPILAEEDFAIMGGDILKAFGPSNVYMVSQIDESYVVYPSYDGEVLDQIQNLTLMGYYVTNGQLGYTTNPPSLVQSSDKSFLSFQPAFRYPWALQAAAMPPGMNCLMSDRIVTFMHGDINPAQTMEATRMTNIVTSFQADAQYNNVYCLSTTIGSEVAHAAHIYYFAEYMSGGKAQWGLRRSRTLYMPNIVSFTVQPGSDQQEANGAADVINQVFMRTILVAQQLTQFDRHPAVVLCSSASVDDADDTTPAATLYSQYNGWLEDINYYTVVTSNSLQQMTQTALLSMFNITQYGRAAQ